MKSKLKLTEMGPQGSGAAFFVLGNTPGKEDEAEVIACTTHYGHLNMSNTATAFLNESNLSLNDVDLVLYAAVHNEVISEIKNCFGSEKCMDYQQYSGIYYTAPGFALHLACDLLKTNANPYKHILICNRLNPKNAGLTLIRKSK
jgi:hypothetical protein